MASRVARRSIAALAGLVLIAIGLIIALPFIASTQIVRDRIASEFSSWSGYRVELGGAPNIDVWPSIRAELPDVVLSGWGAGDSPPVLTSEKIEIGLSAFAALSGDIVPVRVRFVRPVIRVARTEEALPVPQSPAGGKIRRAIEMARVAIGDDPANPNLDELPSDPVGTIEFTEARILGVGDGSEEEAELVSEFSGLLQWPNFNSGLNLTATGVVNGEAVKIESQVAEPLLLLAGGTAQMSVSIESEPLRVSFDGVADIEQPLFIDGETQISTPSLRKMLKWAGSDIEPTVTIGNTSISGRLRGQADSIKIEDAEIAIGDSPGMGVIEVALGGELPAVSGTLAFERLDLVSFLATLAILPAPAGPFSPTTAPRPIGQFDLDLRLSANNASAGPAELTDVAAAVQITESLATFDISDATGFGGNISTGIRIDREAGKEAGEFRLLATGIDSGALAEAGGFERLMPQARGKISVILNGPLATPRAFLRTASGSIAATFDTGTIPDLDIASFVERSMGGGFFALDEVAGGTLAFERAELKATMANGVANIEKAEAKTAKQLISLAGIVPYVGRSLALSGRITPAGEDDGAEPEIAFFVGGSWNAPFISAVLPPRPVE